MAKPWKIDEALWKRIESLLPVHRPGTRGPVPLSDRKCLQNILFVLYTGINWKHLATRARLRIRCHLLAAIPPLVRGRSLGPPSPNAALGAARARRDRLVRGLSRRLPCQGQKGGAGTGPSPVDRGRPGSKHHIACDSAGIPLAILTTAGNVPDIKAAQDLVEAIRPVAGRVGRPRRRPDTILADGGYDSRAFREWLHAKRITSVIPQRGRKKIIGLGRIRWVDEQAIAHLHQFKRLAVRWDRHLLMHQGFTKLAAALICWRRLIRKA